MINFDFSGKRALIFGGSRGIGQGVVQKLTEAGAETIYASRNPMETKTSAKYFPLDLNSEAQISELFKIIDLKGDLDIVINTAAINFCKTIDQISSEEWSDVERVNLKAAFIICKEASLRMKQQRSGKIVNVSSIAGVHRSIVSGIHYVSSKAGLIGLTKQLAFELAEFNVNVNVVCPSQTFTDMLKDSMTDIQLKVLADSIPLKRIATVEEQVNPILFLCSNLSSYITGAVINVNGGQI